MPAFDVSVFLNKSGVGRKIVSFDKKAVVFAQGADCNGVYYIQTGQVKLSVTSRHGREAIVAVLGPGDFLGEGCLAGQTQAMATATVMADGS